MKYEEITRNPEILEYYKRGSANLDALGYTDHSVAHTRLVAGKAAEILDAFGYSAQEAELLCDRHLFMEEGKLRA